ncbi:MAG: exodeoxyribonuclease VII large subunit [Lewinellaceae bacterium]|nr:exodeoxyribonuclease VII large subunit [Saprospiraceae bacterium]MCB9268996.1 exodeoxyribonuclease VII large subunit [Lewinellaceae bacterium]HPG08039.1 exodeoxyribonuclease VII large subunit [Saprospiraceae bacterium]HPR01013.1 exodeoxyribonuclease VII large subunit [Saprospiraceae bacterium]HQU53303.1 exodeoxyribonuclease VII large subunit [Saprospiraceae bacterium]
MQTFSLFDLNEYIRRVIALNFTDAIWITAEINQVGSSRGHYYLDLIQKDEKSDQIIAQAQAAIWSSQYRFLVKKYPDILDNLLQDGTEVRLKIKVDFNERYGLKLIIEDLDAQYTYGQAALKRLRVIETLQREGLIGKNKQVSLPPVVQYIAMISSSTAAGFQDFLNHLGENPYGYRFHVTLFSAAMQGINTEREVSEALEQIAERRDEFDAVCIVRGGGSKLDLAAFDSEALGRKVAWFPLPVLIGIGHDIDQTILDLVGHSSLKTPTAVADLIIDHNARFEGLAEEMANRITLLIRQRLQLESRNLFAIRHDLHRVIKVPILRAQHQLEHYQELRSTLMKSYFREFNLKLDRMEEQLNWKNPLFLMEKGYAWVFTGGKPVHSVREVSPGDEITSYLKDGQVTSTVTDVKTRKP